MSYLGSYYLQRVEIETSWFLKLILYAHIVFLMNHGRMYTASEIFSTRMVSI